jgi:hypothetical protein
MSACAVVEFVPVDCTLDGAESNVVAESGDDDCDDVVAVPAAAAAAVD